MTAAEIRDAILEILHDITPEENLSKLQDELPLRDQLALDSMDFLDIIMELRKRYRVQIPEEDYAQLSTLAGAVNYLAPRMKDIHKPG